MQVHAATLAGEVCSAPDVKVFEITAFKCGLCLCYSLIAAKQKKLLPQVLPCGGGEGLADRFNPSCLCEFLR